MGSVPSPQGILHHLGAASRSPWRSEFPPTQIRQLMFPCMGTLWTYCYVPSLVARHDLDLSRVEFAPNFNGLKLNYGGVPVMTSGFVAQIIQFGNH